MGVELPDNDDARARCSLTAFADRKADEVELELTEPASVAPPSLPTAIPRSSPPTRRSIEAGLAADIEHPLFGTIRRHGLPAVLSETPGRVAPGSLRGQHTEPILAELGYTPEQIAELEAKQVVVRPGLTVAILERTE